MSSPTKRSSGEARRIILVRVRHRKTVVDPPHAEGFMGRFRRGLVGDHVAAGGRYVTARDPHVEEIVDSRVAVGFEELTESREGIARVAGCRCR